MNKNQKIWSWLAAGMSFLAGILLVLKDSGAGWFLIIMGIIYLGALTRPGQRLAVANPTPTRWGLVSVSVLCVLVIIIGAVVLLK
jgi:hypothetical protein